MRQGVAAWLRAWAHLSPAAREPEESSIQAGCLADELRGEVAVILAEMAISAMQGAA
jgi:hypothetical protein